MHSTLFYLSRLARRSLNASPSVILTAPIPLYRRILRAHRKHLPPAERTLGDSYVKAEFRAHKDIDNPLHIVGFLTEWNSYAEIVEGGREKIKEGENKLLTKERVEKMSEDQLYQLYEMMMAAKGVSGTSTQAEGIVVDEDNNSIEAARGKDSEGPGKG